MRTKAAKPAPERRSYEFDVRAVENERGHIITGRPIVYNSRTNIGPFDEIIEAGALDKADLTDVRFLVNHDTEMIPLARSRRNNERSTMHLSPVAEGLDIDWIDLDVENNVTAKALWSATDRGDLSGMSFMFAVADGGERWADLDTDHPTRYITAIAKVYEVSAVTWPAYEETEIYARSRDALDSARSALERARQQRNAGAPEGADMLELLKEKTRTIILTGGLHK